MVVALVVVAAAAVVMMMLVVMADAQGRQRHLNVQQPCLL